MICFVVHNFFCAIQRNFVAQTGDPTGRGQGGESIWGLVESFLGFNFLLFGGGGGSALYYLLLFQQGTNSFF